MNVAMQVSKTLYSSSTIIKEYRGTRLLTKQIIIRYSMKKYSYLIFSSIKLVEFILLPAFLKKFLHSSATEVFFKGSWEQKRPSKWWSYCFIVTYLSFCFLPSSANGKCPMCKYLSFG